MNVCCTYGAPKREDKLSYIDLLFKVINSLPSEPWLVIEDLNLTLVQHEKEGEEVWASNLQRRIALAWTKLNLIHLSFEGDKFTWSNMQEGSSRILARLDRYYSIFLWIDLFPQARLYHMLPCGSDHIPILLNSDPNGR